MSTIIPFHGTLYDATVVGDVKQLVAPPYDIVDAAWQKTLHDRHPHNIIRLELGLDQPGDGPASNRYTRAGSTLRAWLTSGALKRDAQPALYYHTIEYQPPYAPRRLADENPHRVSLHRHTGSARLGQYLPARKYALGRQNRPAESAGSLQHELQPHLVALLGSSGNRDGPAGRSDQRETCCRSTFTTMWDSASSSGP